ncbi:MAG: hypothetical protein IJ228_02135 [Succinivibrio sp.]|nr:hypothetical protein [Succinivibrio sp.]
MILPDKFITPEDCLLGVGAVLLDALRSPQTVSQLWESVRTNTHVETFERFTLGLTLLHIMGAVELQRGMLYKIVPKRVEEA